MFDVKGREERILKFWEEHQIFEKSVQAREKGKPFVFFEGPPTANGNPGIHHVIARVFKDLFSRYQTMRGRYVLRKGGWDTHGLPVELQVEKELGFTSKKDIEKFGIAAFNRKCRESVWKYKAEWDQFTKRIGYWVDLKDPYITYEAPYIESLWNVIGRIAKKKLLYQAHRVVPFCTRCGTPISSHEVAQGYKTVTDVSVYLKFKVVKAPAKLKLPRDTFILAWTTTPWTLPGNVALAVGKNIQYVLAKKPSSAKASAGEGEHYIVAADLANKVLGAPLTIEQQFTGKELVGISYAPLFPVRALKSAKSYKVYPADFVTTTDGTGVVHTAVMYGEDDYRLGDEVGLPKVHTVTEQGTFVGVSKELNGKYVKDATTEKQILDYLGARNLVLATVPYEHEYPFCWRCDTPLLYYAKDSWFIRMSALNKQMLANNETVHWVPEHLKHGRFGQWLREAKDWAFSRERYWGTPLPVWMGRGRDGKPTGTPLVVSSLADLNTYRARKGNTYWLVRHGEAEKNVARIIDDGKNYSPLTQKGVQETDEQAGKTLCKKFGKKKPFLIITSPITRARQTADIIACWLNVKTIHHDSRLEEIHLEPSLEGRPDAEYHAAFPRYQDKFTQQPPEGESLADLKARMWGLLRELEEKYDGKDIVLVSHEYPIWMLADAASGWSMEESIAEKEKRGDDFIPLAGVEKITVRNLPRDERGNVDPHRPYIDRVILKKDGKLLHRVPELCDVWFDSGSMPYAQWHWPFENDAVFKQQFPADFIAEAVDQTRGWFYTLLAVSTLLGDGAPYRAVVSLGHVLDEKGQKMSKSRGNVILPNDVFNAVGVDATRWYFYTVNNPGDTKLFSLREVRERLTGFLGTLENCVRFWELYADRPEARAFSHGNRPTHQLDRWVFSRLHGLIAKTTASLDAYDLMGAARNIEQFVVDDLSQWWLRRSRKRTHALGLLRHVLLEVSKLIAPFTPFAAEDIHQRLHVGTKANTHSVHLHDWPVADASFIDMALETDMAETREFITEILAIRKEEGIKVRQPLASATGPTAPQHEELKSLARDELNVKEIIHGATGPTGPLDLVITPELRAEGWAREVSRALQELRKEAGLQVGQKAYGQWHTESAEIAQAMLAHIGAIVSDTSLTQFVRSPDQTSLTVERTFELAPGKSIWIGIRK